MLLPYLVDLPAEVADGVYDGKSKISVPTTPVFCRLRLIGVGSGQMLPD